jgi:hypothetical protein
MVERAEGTRVQELMKTCKKLDGEDLVENLGARQSETCFRVWKMIFLTVSRRPALLQILGS